MSQLERFAGQPQLNIACYEHDLSSIPGVRLIGTAADKASVASFVLAEYSTEDVGRASSEEGIAVRSGAPLRPTDPASLRRRSHGPAVAGLLQHLRRNRSHAGRGTPPGKRQGQGCCLIFISMKSKRPGIPSLIYIVALSS